MSMEYTGTNLVLKRKQPNRTPFRFSPFPLLIEFLPLPMFSNVIWRLVPDATLQFQLFKTCSSMWSSSGGSPGTKLAMKNLTKKRLVPIQKKPEERNIEQCPGCDCPVLHGEFEEEVVIASGKEWHRPGYDAVCKKAPDKSNNIDAKNTELCPSCGQSIARGEFDDERIVASGKEWHKPCYEAYQRERAASRKHVSVHEKNLEECPGCSRPIDRGEFAEERIIAAGKEWHKPCWTAINPQTLKKSNVDQLNREECPGCQRSVEKGEFAEECIVAAGKEWHRTCWDAAKGARRDQSSRVQETNRETCPGCGDSVMPNSPAVIVVSGCTWHRGCFQKDV